MALTTLSGRTEDFWQLFCQRQDSSRCGGV